ncbi:MAG: HAMP domain-containing protein [Burkholderiales bacterium]|nr:HAMP domain-containing protein [Burkholderiales bacterium]
MKLADLKITVRLGLLGLFFLFALLAVGLGSWQAMQAMNAQSNSAMQKASTLSLAIDTARSAQVEFKIQVQEWKNILLRGNDPTQLEKYTAAFKKSGASTRAELQKTQQLLKQLQVSTPLVEEAIQALDQLNLSYLNALQKYDSANPESAHIVDALVKGMDRPPTKKIDDIVTHIQAQSQKLLAAMEAENAQTQRDAMLQLVCIVLMTTIIGGFTMVWLARSITKPLNAAVAIAQLVAAGDLRSDIEVSSKDEIGMLLAALGRMHDSLAEIVGQVRVGADAIAYASEEIASGNQDLSARTEEEASSLEETAATMEELTSTVKQNSGHANSASELAGLASQVAARGGSAVSQVVSTMAAINDSSSKMFDIISVIDGIAFQTNILALNAAVEAARSGEQGRGFAVVASEVRSLAQRSAAAAKEIKVLISDSVERVEKGSKMVAQAGITMDEVVDSVQRVTTIIAEIATSSSAQHFGIEQINVAVSQMDTVTQQNAALVEQAAAAAEALQQQAIKLSQAVSVFKINPAHLPSADNAFIGTHHHQHRQFALR